MSEEDADRAAFEAFLLAVRVVCHAYGIEPPGTEFGKPWELLREIARGELTLSNPAEMAARFPQMRDLLYDAANRVVEHDREVAERVLRGLGRAF